MALNITIRLRPLARIFKDIWQFYYTGFREMTIGKTLWMIILLKLFIFFIVMKMLFFPNLLSRDFDTDEERAEHVRHELTNARERNRTKG